MIMPWKRLVCDLGLCALVQAFSAGSVDGARLAEPRNQIRWRCDIDALLPGPLGQPLVARHQHGALILGCQGEQCVLRMPAPARVGILRCQLVIEAACTFIGEELCLIEPAYIKHKANSWDVLTTEEVAHSGELGRGLPMDYDELERWTRVGFERGTRSRHGER
jgi:hypothetical protein